LASRVLPRRLVRTTRDSLPHGDLDAREAAPHTNRSKPIELTTLVRIPVRPFTAIDDRHATCPSLAKGRRQAVALNEESIHGRMHTGQIRRWANVRCPRSPQWRALHGGRDDAIDE